MSIYVVACGEALRTGLVASLGLQERIEVLGHAGSLREMLDEGKFVHADVLVVDVDMLTEANSTLLSAPGETMLPGLKVLFLGTREDEQNIRPEDVPAYMAIETVGFISKHTPSDKMAYTIELLADGKFVCESRVIKRMLTRMIEWSSYPPADQGQLSGRETEVLRLIAQGATYEEVARELFVAQGTIRAHVSHLKAKLGLRGRIDLARYAVACGLVPARDQPAEELN